MLRVVAGACAIGIAVVACGSRTALDRAEDSTTLPGGTDSTPLRACPSQRPALNESCVIDRSNAFACEYDGDVCSDGSTERRIYACYAVRNGTAAWLYASDLPCGCPRWAPAPGSACTSPLGGRSCTYPADACEPTCTCTNRGWDCRSTCPERNCPRNVPAQFAGCSKVGLTCPYATDSRCPVTVECVAVQNGPRAGKGYWIAVDSPGRCDGF